jgi:cation transport ATPase
MTQLHGGERQLRQEPAQRLSRESQPRKQKWSKETYIAFLAASAILVHLIIRFALREPALQYNAPLLLTLLIGGTPLLYDLLKRLIRREFGSDLLAGMSIAAALVLGEYLAGSIVVLMLSSGTALEQYATRRASSVLAALAKRMPRNAHKLTGSRIVPISLEDVQIGDRLIVLPHEICPVDGTVTSGRGAMDESYLTGEPFVIAKAPGSDVLSGAVNGEEALTISVTKLPTDSRYAKIMRVMQEAETNRPRMRRIADRLGAWYTLLGVAVGGLGWILGRDPRRFLAVLVIATPVPALACHSGRDHWCDLNCRQPGHYRQESSHARENQFLPNGHLR